MIDLATMSAEPMKQVRELINGRKAMDKITRVLADLWTKQIASFRANVETMHYIGGQCGSFAGTVMLRCAQS